MTDGGAQETTRHLKFLETVMKARAKVIVAEVELIHARRVAKSGGVSDEEIAAAIRMVEKNAGIR